MINGMKKTPCDLDHNGECLVCDCWLSDCAIQRLHDRNYRYESREELLILLKDYLNEDYFTKAALDKLLAD